MHELKNNIIDIYGENGRRWLKNLSAVKSSLAIDWNFEEISPYENLTYSYVCKVKIKEKNAVLKITPPSPRTAREIEWYLFQQGEGTPKLLANSVGKGALLLEQIKPATTAKSLVIAGKDFEATVAITQAMNGLNHKKSASNQFPHVRDFTKNLTDLKGHVPKKLLAYAIKRLDLLTQDKAADVVLHGDLHHDNILNHQGAWVAIDPHGYIGPRGFEVGAMMRNPYDCFPSGNLYDVINSRIDVLEHKLQLPRQEIVDWSLIYTLIATSWSLRDHSEIPLVHIEIAEILTSA